MARDQHDKLVEALAKCNGDAERGPAAPEAGTEDEEEKALDEKRQKKVEKEEKSGPRKRRRGGKRDSRVCGCIPASPESAKAFRQMLDLSLLRNTIFLMFSASNFLTSIGFNVPYVYTVVYPIIQ